MGVRQGGKEPGPASSHPPSVLTPWPRTLTSAMSLTDPLPHSHDGTRELPVPELLRRARPLPPPDDLTIDDLTEEEGAAYLAALEA